MKKICNHCNQVIPEAPEEKRLAEEKVSLTIHQTREARGAWKRFYRPNKPVIPTGAKVSVAVLAAIAWEVGFSLLILLPYGHGLTFVNVYRVLATSVLVCFTLLWFLVLKPQKKEADEKTAYKKKFSEEHKEYAEILGFVSSN